MCYVGVWSSLSVWWYAKSLSWHTVVSADNLAAWNIGGYKAVPSAFRKCQYCMMVDKDIQTKVNTFFFQNTCTVKNALSFWQSLSHQQNVVVTDVCWEWNYSVKTQVLLCLNVCFCELSINYAQEQWFVNMNLQILLDKILCCINKRYAVIKLLHSINKTIVHETVWSVL